MKLSDLKIGDIVTTITPVEALDSGMYEWSPVQFFKPGMHGIVICTSSPAVRRNIDQAVVKFIGTPYGNSDDLSFEWRVRLDPSQIKLIK